MNALTLSFKNTNFQITDINGQPWLRGYQIGNALEYSDGAVAIAKLYNRNADEFTDSMTQVIELPTAGGKQQVRIFSLRGCHLLGMLARTNVAKEFRRWVLDVLEKETSRNVQPTSISDLSHRLSDLESQVSDLRSQIAGLPSPLPESPQIPYGIPFKVKVNGHDIHVMHDKDEGLLVCAKDTCCASKLRWETQRQRLSGNCLYRKFGLKGKPAICLTLPTLLDWLQAKSVAKVSHPADLRRTVYGLSALTCKRLN